MISRRGILGFGLAFAACLPGAQRAAAQSHAGQTLRFATYGGTWQQWIAKTVEPIFKARTGAAVEYVPGTPLQHLASLVAGRGQNPPFDLVSLSDDLSITALKQGLILPQDGKSIPNVSKLPEVWRPNKDHGPADFAGL